MDGLKHLINQLAVPPIMFTGLIAVFFFIFPVNDWFEKWNQKLKIHLLWTKQGGLLLLALLTGALLFGITDANFRLIVFKPDNLPIVLLIYLAGFFLWFSMHQGYLNDARRLKGEKPQEWHDAQEKIMVWPDLVFIEFICMILAVVFLLAWGIAIDAPLEEAANPTSSPNPAKAPWYFLALQEMLVYFDPWLAGVLIPTVIVIGLMAIPYIDTNWRASGYYTFKERRMAVSIFLFGWLALWLFLMTIGTFLRGPNWNLFGPFEFWDPHKLEALTNVNLSEYVYVVGLKSGLPKSIFLREMWGFILLGIYFLGAPLLLTKTVFNKLAAKLGPIRYSVFLMLLLIALSLPIKMYLRWVFNLKYIVSIPEFFFNI